MIEYNSSGVLKLGICMDEVRIRDKSDKSHSPGLRAYELQESLLKDRRHIIYRRTKSGDVT